MTFSAPASRVDAVIRLAGLIVLGFGLAMISQTYSNSTVLAPAIVTINYALGALLFGAGLLAVTAKFK